MAEKDARIGKRYAQALFQTSLRYDLAQAVEDDLNAIVNLLEREGLFQDFVIAPYTSREEKSQIIEKIFSDRITALTMQLLRVMLEKRRENEIVAVRDEFAELRREHDKVVRVIVSSAHELGADQRERLEANISKRLGRKVETTYQLEPSLVAGVKIQYGNYVLDGSVKGAVAALRDRLRHDILKQN